MTLNDDFEKPLYDENEDDYNFENDDFQSVTRDGRCVYSSSLETFHNFKDDTLQSRLGRTSVGDSVRPMTATGGAGFQSRKKSNSSIDVMRTASDKVYANAKQITEKSPIEISKEMEKEIHTLFEESATLLKKQKYFHALQKAEQAVHRDQILIDHRESYSIAVHQQDQRLSFATRFNAAIVYERNQRYGKAFETYEQLIKKKTFPEYNVQIRINIGNLYLKDEKLSQAIRMYKMALDQTPNEDKEMRMQILKNIGNVFLKLGRLRNAIVSFENAVRLKFDSKCYFNLISCHVESNNIEKSKQALFKMISGSPRKIDDVSEALEQPGFKDHQNKELTCNVSPNTDSLLHYASRLVANMRKDKNWIDNYVWVYEHLHEKFPHLAFQLDIERAVEHLNRGEYLAAVKIFKSYESEDAKYKTMVAVNLSFFYFLEGDYSIAEHYADLAMSSNKYNPYALVNKGNCLFIKEDYAGARRLYLEAITIKSSCYEAIYNLALTCLRLGQTQEALQSYTKLHTVSSNDPRVLYQVANIYEEMDDKIKAMKWFNVLNAVTPTDPGVLSRLGQLFLSSNNESQSFHFHLESYRSLPSDIDVIGWLAIWFVKHEMIEKSIPFFFRASQIQPKERKWKIMVATCYRKMGEDTKALTIYKKILKYDPQNAECLEHLISICKERGESFESYELELENVKKMVHIDSGIDDVRPSKSTAVNISNSPQGFNTNITDEDVSILLT